MILHVRLKPIHVRHVRLKPIPLLRVNVVHDVYVRSDSEWYGVVDQVGGCRLVFCSARFFSDHAHFRPSQ
jgi:hypothetical protein